MVEINRLFPYGNFVHIRSGRASVPVVIKYVRCRKEAVLELEQPDSPLVLEHLDNFFFSRLLLYIEQHSGGMSVTDRRGYNRRQHLDIRADVREVLALMTRDRSRQQSIDRALMSFGYVRGPSRDHTNRFLYAQCPVTGEYLTSNSGRVTGEHLYILLAFDLFIVRHRVEHNITGAELFSGLEYSRNIVLLIELAVLGTYTGRTRVNDRIDFRQQFFECTFYLDTLLFDLCNLIFQAAKERLSLSGLFQSQHGK